MTICIGANPIKHAIIIHVYQSALEKPAAIDNVSDSIPAGLFLSFQLEHRPLTSSDFPTLQCGKAA